MNRCTTATLAVTLTLFTGAGRLSAQAPKGLTPALDSVRMALEKYKDPLAAVRDGYFSTVACIDFPTAVHAGDVTWPAGAMGVHLLNLSAVSPQPDPKRPPVLIYEPHGDTLQLVGAEWFVPSQLVKERPELLGRPLDGPMAGHEPIMPAALEHYDLHVWLWRTNPAGLYTPTNAAVKCPGSVYTAHMHEEQHAH